MIEEMMSKRVYGDPLVVGESSFKPGQKGMEQLVVGESIHGQPVSMPVFVRRGRKAGPRVFLSAAIHGDEINGVEIIRRLLASSTLKKLRGDIMAVPIVNMPAFLARSRYLPDRRDLNRMFPGKGAGSMGARIAHAFDKQVVSQCDAGIDFHTGALNRPNLPHIRCSPEDGKANELALAFHTPVVVQKASAEGTLRAHCDARGIPCLLYEAGEASCLDPAAVRLGFKGALGVLRALGMLPPLKKPAKRPRTPTVSSSTHWERSPAGGIFSASVSLGNAVGEGAVLGVVADPLGGTTTEVTARSAGVIIGRNQFATVNEGEAHLHIAEAKNPSATERKIEALGALPTEDSFDHAAEDGGG